MATIANIIDKLRGKFERNQIHWRAQSVTKDGKSCMALAYLDARAVMDRLDKAVGPENWQTEYFPAGDGRLGCRLGIRIKDEWVWKSDGAGETDVEGEKGAFSSALKRAAVSWGIGRYLYDFPVIWVPCESYQSNGKWRFKKFTDNPWKYCEKAVKQDAEGNVGMAKKAFDEFKDNIAAASDLDSLQIYLEQDYTKRLIARFHDVIPEWAQGGGDIPGIDQMIANRRRELQAEEEAA